MCIVGLRRRAAALWLLVAAMEGCPLGGSRRFLLLKAEERAEERGVGGRMGCIMGP